MNALTGQTIAALGVAAYAVWIAARPQTAPRERLYRLSVGAAALAYGFLTLAVESYQTGNGWLALVCVIVMAASLVAVVESYQRAEGRGSDQPPPPSDQTTKNRKVTTEPTTAHQGGARHRRRTNPRASDPGTPTGERTSS